MLHHLAGVRIPDPFAEGLLGEACQPGQRDVAPPAEGEHQSCGESEGVERRAPFDLEIGVGRVHRKHDAAYRARRADRAFDVAAEPFGLDRLALIGRRLGETERATAGRVEWPVGGRERCLSAVGVQPARGAARLPVRIAHVAR